MLVSAVNVASDHVQFWWVSLGLGAVVIAAVILLLFLLHTFVSDIDRNVREVWETATRVAQNTSTTWMLNQTGVLTGELRDEVRKHAQLMQYAAGGRR
ncbi:MAG: hypothetical protein ACLGI2_15765 [Acidimicrobiia bacterium]